MASTTDTESVSVHHKISPRDAVRREVLKYFSSNPGPDNLASNTCVHGQAIHCLRTQDMSIEDLVGLSLNLLDRNTSSRLAQRCVEAMQITPVCEYSEFHHIGSIGNKLADLARDLKIWRNIAKAEVFPSITVGVCESWEKPRMYLEQSLVAAGVVSSEELDRKLSMAKETMQEESNHLRTVEAAVKQEPVNDCELKGRYRPALLLLTCCMDQEFEYEKREMCGKLVYYNDANKRAYNILEAVGVKPFYLFEAFGSYAWSSHNRAKDLSDRGLSLLEGIYPSETALDRKVQRYIVCHFLFLNAGPMKDLSLLEEAVETEIDSGNSAGGLEFSEAEAHKL